MRPERAAAYRPVGTVEALRAARLVRDAGHVLHGEPHGGNVIATSDGVRFCDFESVCRGPLEWDLAYLPPECVRGFGGIDVGLVELLRGVVSAHVATSCWAKLRTLDDEGERWHAEHHLAQAIDAARAVADD